MIYLLFARDIYSSALANVTKPMKMVEILVLEVGLLRFSLVFFGFNADLFFVLLPFLWLAHQCECESFHRNPFLPFLCDAFLALFRTCIRMMSMSKRAAISVFSLASLQTHVNFNFYAFTCIADTRENTALFR